MRKPDGQTLFLGSAILGGAVLVLYLAFFHGNGQAGNASAIDLKHEFSQNNTRANNPVCTFSNFILKKI